MGSARRKWGSFQGREHFGVGNHFGSCTDHVLHITKNPASGRMEDLNPVHPNNNTSAHAPCVLSKMSLVAATRSKSLQQIASCDMVKRDSLLKSLSLRQSFVAAQIFRTNSNRFESVRLIAATKFCRKKIHRVTRGEANYLQRPVSGTCYSD